jgi:protein TonB
MTGQQRSNPGDLVATRADRGNVAILHDVAAVVPRDDLAVPLSPEADLSNVIPFARVRRGGEPSGPSAPPVIVSPADRPAPPLSGTKPWLQAVLVMCSLIVHGGLFYAFWQEPQPLPGIGIEPITVEVVIGDNRPAGAAATPGEAQVDSTKVEELKPAEKPIEEEQVAETRELKPDETRTEVAEEQAVEQPKQREPETRQEIAMVETPQAEIPTALPRETPPDMTAIIAPPRDEPKEVKPEPKAKQQKQKEKKAKQPSPETRAASGSGPRSVASLANYNGQVSAHLRRYQQYPAAARSNGITGSGTVTFSISGSGSVTSVRVTRGTGAAVLDQELAAMVRRASPFPAPPDGQARNFSVPVSFDLQR